MVNELIPQLSSLSLVSTGQQKKIIPAFTGNQFPVSSLYLLTLLTELVYFHWINYNTLSKNPPYLNTSGNA